MILNKPNLMKKNLNTTKRPWMESKESKSTQMSLNGPKWVYISSYEPKWAQMSFNNPNWV